MGFKAIWKCTIALISSIRSAPESTPQQNTQTPPLRAFKITQHTQTPRLRRTRALSRIYRPHTPFLQRFVRARSGSIKGARPRREVWVEAEVRAIREECKFAMHMMQHPEPLATLGATQRGALHYRRHSYEMAHYGHLHLRFLFEEEFGGEGFGRLPLQACATCGERSGMWVRCARCEDRILRSDPEEALAIEAECRDWRRHVSILDSCDLCEDKFLERLI